ncbi:MAG TPA: MFS transporter [Candidatus Binatia bacterium]|jgi:predicted MFS family arabinose efflux permease|nr:MFS transporter [Candidatus Binatia bacterium]
MTDNNNGSWLFGTLAAAAVLTVTMGARQSLGLFIFPLNNSTGLGLVTISFALAVGQFVWGAVQPLAGAAADRFGPARVLVGGVLILAMGSVLTPFMTSALGLVISLGLLSAIGAGAASFSVLIGAVAGRVPASQRGSAAGIINAGGSFGQFVFAPLLQALITLLGWMGAMWSLAVITLAALPLVRLMRRSSPVAVSSTHESFVSVGTLRMAVKNALADRNYLLLHAGFFTCGFHIALIVTHLPGEVNLHGLTASVASWSLAVIGLSNIAGSLVAGWCVNHFRGKYVLFYIYGSRAMLVLLYLAAPKSAWTFYLYAIGLGFTWLATVPPTAGVIGKLFGTRYLATLFGLTLLSHQTGGFLGAWLGGLVFSQYGDYLLMWYADAVLAAGAALCNLPIREPRAEPIAVLA